MPYGNNGQNALDRNDALFSYVILNIYKGVQMSVV